MRIAMYVCAAIGMSGLVAFIPAARADDTHAGHLGKVDLPVSCSAAAQQQFTQGLLLLHHMTYPQARAAFERAAQIDPACAMAQWGIAMTLFQPLWPTRPTTADLQRGLAATRKADALHPQKDREGWLIAAVSAFFAEPATDYWQRIHRWEGAQRRAWEALPDDSEVEVFYALAHLAASPQNSASRKVADESAAILLEVYRRNPDHPGAMHYLVHANDVPGREHELLEITDRYAGLAPDNPHALHMPTHIYTRLGDWDGVIRGNLRAADAALRYPAGEHGEYVWDEFAHATEYLVYAYLQEGNDAAAAAQVKRLRDKPHMEPSFKTAFHLSSTQARYALERRAWNEAAQLVPRQPGSLDWNRFSWPEATMVFARGLGESKTNQLDKAQASLRRLQELETATRESGESLFARNITVLRLELSSWLAQAEGHSDAAVASMREAADLEAATPKHPVTPAPTLPANEQLGDLLREQKRPAEALRAYQRSLQFCPRRFNSIEGAAASALAVNDQATARSFYQQLIELAPQSQRDAVRGARRFLAQGE